MASVLARSRGLRPARLRGRMEQNRDGMVAAQVGESPQGVIKENWMKANSDRVEEAVGGMKLLECANMEEF